ncbi:RHS repeat domain-containing protein [Flavobacterium aestivum]|uniref:RHS repeat domain-containing protein n=1 Tax=Flavobacterium aestivum TaxID=3003257 RepID=UPI002482764E|nr:RHS repeat-associated core domain-containing protein [Flavobacterium aestivum]
MANAKGLATGSWTRVLTSSTENLGETTSTFYDSKAKPIRSYTQNHLGGYSYTDSKLDFTGKPFYTITKHKRATGDAELVVKEDFTYSPQGLLLTHTHQINGGAIQLLAANTYDDLGQLSSKKVGNNSGTPLQKVDYSYNIRGWLTGINKIINLQQDTDPKDWFAFAINYNKPTTTAGAKSLYNGNIAEIFWLSNSDGTSRSYGYQYDDLNRLKKAIYQKPGENIPVSGAYNESLSYDKNGNILSLQRFGGSDAPSIIFQIDDLTYDYSNANSNQLTKVTDSPAGNDSQGFIDGNKTGDDYSYDANGNMITDKNKNITAIVYNHLNLPAKITFGSGNFIAYIYDATGIKVKKTVTVLSPASTIVTDYLGGGFQYENNVLKFFPTAEGYVEPNGSSYKYVFQYKDHLGNVRLSYGDANGDGTITNNEIIEESHYYPFGLKHQGYNSVVTSTNPAQKRLFGGKELQDELDLNVYDYGARIYTPDRPGFWQIDPKAETSRRFSPYAYAMDNPVYFIDPDGMEATDWYKDLKGVMQFDPKVQSQKDLGNKGTYVGDTDKQTTASGGTADFRKDGSIMYSNEKDAYSRVMNNTKATGREQLAVIGDKSALVLPDYNNSRSEGNGGGMGYSYKNGNLQDPVTGKEFNTIGTVHAHMSGNGPSDYTGDGWGDLDFARSSTPNKPAFVMQNEKGTDGLSVIFASPYAKGTPVNYRVMDLTQSMPNINADNIQKGSTSLRNFAKSVDWKGMLKK